MWDFSALRGSLGWTVVPVEGPSLPNEARHLDHQSDDSPTSFSFWFFSPHWPAFSLVICCDAKHCHILILAKVSICTYVTPILQSEAEFISYQAQSVHKCQSRAVFCVFRGDRWGPLTYSSSSSMIRFKTLSRELRPISRLIEDLLVKFCGMLHFSYLTERDIDTALYTFNESFLASTLNEHIGKMYVIQQQIESKQPASRRDH